MTHVGSQRHSIQTNKQTNKQEEIRGGCRRLHNVEIRNLFSSHSLCMNMRD
jgi:hypothetical protein